MLKGNPRFGERDTKKLLFILVPLTIFLLISSSGCISQTNPTNQTNVTSVTVIPPYTFIQPTTPTYVECPTLENASPYIIVNPIGINNPGDVVDINGTTNLDIDSKLIIFIGESPLHEVAPSSITPTVTPSATVSPYQYFEHKGYVTIQNGTCGRNFWSYRVTLPKDHYPWEHEYAVNVALSNGSFNNYSSPIKINMDPFFNNITGVK